MYHYRECGLPNIYLANGYQFVETSHGRAVSIEDIEGLHAVISENLVERKPFLTGPEFRFIRKYLQKTQGEIAELIGLSEQSIRRWEHLSRVPKHANNVIRYIFRDLTGKPSKTLDSLLRSLERKSQHKEFKFSYSAISEPIHWRENDRVCA